MHHRLPLPAGTAVRDDRAREHVLDESVLAEPEPRRRPAADLLSSTPGRFSLIGAVLVIAVVVAGVLTATGVSSRSDRISDLHTHSEPLANAALDLYSSLSIADAAATTGFVSAGTEPEALRNRYDSAIAQASGALVTAANGLDTTDTAALQLVSRIAGELSVYTSLVATARTENLVGNAVGIAYLTEASNLMQATVLPLAERLYVDRSQALTEAQRDIAAVPTALTAYVFVILLLLVATQVYLARRTRRVLSPALIAGSLAATLLLVWMLAAGLTASAFVDRARTQGGAPMDTLAKARIYAQQARADETLGLLRRGESTDYDASFTGHTLALSSLLNGYLKDAGIAHGKTEVRAAAAALDQWKQAHQRISADLTSGDFGSATASEIGTGEQDSSTQFARLDTNLQHAITLLREDERSAMSDAHESLAVLPLGAALLAAFCSVTIVVGIWPRVSEYQ